MIRQFQRAMVGVVVLLATQQAHAEVMNGGFETGDYTGWSTIGNASNPSVVDGSFGTGPPGGTYQALMSTNDTTKTDADIETFLGLSSGTLDTLSGGDAIEGTAIKQSIMGNVGDIVMFDWNFLTTENPNSSVTNDFAFWTLVNEQNGAVLADTTASSLGISSTIFDLETGFHTTMLQLTSSGLFTLGFGVMDVGDANGDSGLLVDNVKIGPVPEPASATLFGLGAIGMAFGAARRRRREKQRVAA